MEINTPKGTIKVIQPEGSRLRSLRSALPLGAVAYSQDAGGARYGIVMKAGSTEAWAIKQQSPEIPEDSLQTAYLANSILIALSIKRYISAGFGGSFMPCPYFRKKSNGIESGIAYFGSPLSTGIEATKSPFEGAFDNQFGHGFSTMLKHFVESLKTSSAESGITLQPCIGLDYRPRSALDSIGLHFLIHGSELYTLKKQISEVDPVWTALRSTGIDVIYHLPSVPAEITEEQLSISKPQQ